MLLVRRLCPAVLGVLILALVSISTTGEGAAGSAVEPSFVQGRLTATISSPTSVASGPDGRLDVAGRSEIRALTLDPATQAVVDDELIASGLQDVMGIAFDPTTPSPVKVYASHQNSSATRGFWGVVSTFTAPGWTKEDIITGLPTGWETLNHITNGLDFDSAGTLFIAQGSSTDAGLTFDRQWPETPLSAAILVADIDEPGFDGTITYSPAGQPEDHSVDQTGGDVAVYASGTRNPFDLVIHSNGEIYATDNGPTGPRKSTACDTEDNLGVSFNDELNRIVQGIYYGHPNRNRGRGDPLECTYLPPQWGSGSGYMAPIAIMQEHCSCDGIDEYTAATFGGAMQGDLLIAQWSFGKVVRVELSSDGLTVESISTLAMGLSNPLDVTAGPDGTVYVAEISGDSIAYLAPDSDRDGCADGREAGPNPVLGGMRDAAHFWDFFDTPGAGNERDRVIDIGDIFRVVERFGATGNPAGDPLTAPPASGFHTAFDRSPSSPGGDAWDLNGPDGVIDTGDIFASVNQFGHSCV